MDSDSWNTRYGEAATQADTVWSLEPNVWVAETVASLTPGTAVDLAAGEGRNALWLASLGWRVTAVDFAAVGLATGAGRAEQLGLEVGWLTADATTWRSPEPVDLVVVAYLQLPADDIAAVIGNAAASLAPGGTLALIGHDRENLERGVGGPQDPAVLLTVDELRAAASGLKIVECRQYERRTADGRTAIDAILVARKN
jgi:SAM-dependent methyltransferase